MTFEVKALTLTMAHRCVTAATPIRLISKELNADKTHCYTSPF